MRREPDERLTLSLPAEQLELTLARIEASPAFRGSPRHRQLLRHLVERSFAGDLASLKESVLGVEVFGRPAGSFDPKSDSIVRVEARRLRQRLRRFYAADGAAAPLRIELPVGSYVPALAEAPAAAAPDERAARAADLVARGEHFLRQPLSRSTLETALARFDEALRITPDSVPAHVGMARAWLNLATGWHHPPAIAGEHAAEALRQALALDPDHAVAHVLLGAMQNLFERDWAGARRSFRRATALAPEDAFVHSAFGMHLLMRGLDDEAEKSLQLARHLDPLYVNSRSGLANLRLRQRRWDEARREIDAMLDVAPDSLAAQGLAGVLALAQGDAEGAVAIYTRLAADLPEHPGCLASLAAAEAAAGRVARADELLGQLERRFGDHIVSPYVLAIVAVRAGRRALAFELLERADADRDPNALMIPLDPSFVSLHDDSRWPALAERVQGTARPRRRARG